MDINDTPDTHDQGQGPEKFYSEIYPNLRGAGETPAPTPEGGTAVAVWRPEVQISTRLKGDLVRIAAAGIGGNLRRAKREANNRMYADPLNPNVPRIFKLEFTNNKGTLKEPVPRTRTRVNLDGEMVEVDVGMLHDVELNFSVLKRTGSGWVPNGSYFCALLRPARGNAATGLWKAVPVGLVSREILDAYNVLQEQRKRPTIEPLPHRIDSVGTLRMKFKATQWEKRESEYLIGTRCRRNLILHMDSPTPMHRRTASGDIAEEEDGSLAFVEAIYRVVVREHCYYLTWLGPASKLSVDERVPIVEAQDRIDPYRALGQSIHELDLDNLEGRRRLVFNTLRREDNCLRVYAEELGVLKRDDNIEMVRNVADELLRAAVHAAAEDMWNEWNRLKTRFIDMPGLLTIEEVLGSLQDTPENRGKVRNRRQPPAEGDFVAKQIEAMACADGETFNWKSPMQRKLRQWIVERVFELTNASSRATTSEPVASGDQEEATASPEEPSN